MSPNSDSEFRIPNRPDEEQTVYDNLRTIYQGEDLEKNTEQSVPVCEHLIKISDEIAVARTQKIAEKAGRNRVIANIGKQLFNRVLPINYVSAQTKQDLINLESQIGSAIFDPIKDSRVFKNRTAQKLFWYGGSHNLKDGSKVEDWFYCQQDFGNGQSESVTLHYEVGDRYILKICSLADVPNQVVDGQELKNLILATDIYHDRVMKQIYGRAVA